MKRNMYEQTIDRRTLLRDFLIVSAGIVFLPACAHNEGKASIALKNIQLTAGDEKLIAAICDALIPATDTPGATETGLPLFVMKMLDDCYLKSDQEKLLKGLRAFEDGARKKFGTPFSSCQPGQKAELLQALERQKGKEDDLPHFYFTCKKLAVQGYTTSQYYLTNVHKYELVPGRFHGCVPVPSFSAKPKTV